MKRDDKVQKVIEMINPAMVMKCVVYEDGQRFEDIELEQISHWLQREQAFVWLGLREANKALLSNIQEAFGLHELAVEDACSAHQRPKLEEYGETLFMVLHTAQLVE